MDAVDTAHFLPPQWRREDLPIFKAMEGAAKIEWSMVTEFLM